MQERQAIVGASHACSKNMVMTGRHGLHLRNAYLLVKLALAYKAEVQLQYAGNCVNARSLMGILTLGVVSGAEVTVTTQGDDAATALAAIENLFVNGFDENGEETSVLFAAEGRNTP